MRHDKYDVPAVNNNRIVSNHLSNPVLPNLMRSGTGTFIALSAGGTRMPRASVPPTRIAQKRKYRSHCALYNGIKSIKCDCSVIGPAVPGSHGLSSQQPGKSLGSSEWELDMAEVYKRYEDKFAICVFYWTLDTFLHRSAMTFQASAAMSAAGAIHVPPQAITPGADRYSARFSCVTPPVGMNRTPVCLYGP